MLLFHAPPGIEPSDSFLLNNGCFDEFLLLPGSGPHNEIFSICLSRGHLMDSVWLTFI